MAASGCFPNTSGWSYEKGGYREKMVDLPDERRDLKVAGEGVNMKEEGIEISQTTWMSGGSAIRRF